MCDGEKGKEGRKKKRKEGRKWGAGIKYNWENINIRGN